MEQPKKAPAANTSGRQGCLFPVKKVVLSKNGIGYFERQDEVDGNSSFQLYFKSGDMNDVLKSLTMVDIGPKGGLVSSVSYESTKPFDKQLEDLSIVLNEQSGLLDLIAQVKGTHVEVEVRRGGSKVERLSGTVVGVERQHRQHPSPHQVYLMSLLNQSAAVQFFDLSSVVSLTFTNELLQKDLQHLLDILLQAKKKDLKSVTAFTRGISDRRTIRASYVVEAPVWKTSYRLMLVNKPEPAADAKDKQKEGEGPKSLFQGWALVDNTQNEDWKEVELSLVAGAANSFIYDLYNPRYVKRTEIEVVQEETHAPPTLEDTVAQRDVSSLTEATASVEQRQRKSVIHAAAVPSPARAPMPRALAAPKMMMAKQSIARMEECEMECASASYGSLPMEEDDPFSGGVPGGAPPPALESFSRADASQSVAVNVEGKKMQMADMFQYKITNAVNVNRNQSALVPFLQAEFKGSKVAVFNKNVQTNNPLLAIRLKNTFNMPLEGGPLTIFEDDLYVGEAMLGNISPNEEKFVAYSVELKCDVTSQEDNELRDVYYVEIGTSEYNKGRLTFSRFRVYSTTYVFDNKNERAIEELFLEHPRRSSGSLIETPAADETLDHFYRFKLKVPAKGVVKFVVKEREWASETHYLSNAQVHDAEEWLQKGYIDEAVASEINNIVGLADTIKEMESERSLLESYQSELQQDINRFDDMLGALSNSKSATFSGQQKFRDFFTKEQNAAKKEKVGVDETLQKLREQISDTQTKRNNVINGVRFSRTIPNARQ